MTPSIWAPEPKRVIPPGLRRPIFPGERGWDEVWRLYGLINTGLVNDGHAMVNAGIIRAAVAAPTTILSDTFTDGSGTNLTAHTPEIGTAWTATGTFLIDGSNRAYCSALNAGGVAMALSGSPSGANYKVTATIARLTNLQEFGIVVRGAFSGTTLSGGYSLSLADNSPGTNWVLRKTNSNLVTILASGSLSNTGSHTLVLHVSGTTITSTIDGSQVDSRTDTTTSTANQPGLFSVGGGAAIGTGYHIDTILAEPV